ncbi:MAG TPA: polymer-forming cytoskeletal protein [Rhodanobacteraceae bacterium]|nr:polymer-forming cytoskeletal protein [Rhodanobacteraceae bacterium]
MFSSNKKAAAPFGSTTLIAKGTVVRGDISFGGALYLEGRVEGTLRAEGGEAVLTLSDQGAVHGEIHAPRVTINGEVRGDIHAGERLELAGAARIEGNVYYKVLEMAAGAQVNGRMVHQAEVPKQLPRPQSDEAAEPAGASAAKA